MNTATALPIRSDVDISALFDQDRDLEGPIKRRLLLTYICKQRSPDASPDELNRKYHITRNAKDVARCLSYLSGLDHKLRSAFHGVDFTKPFEILAHTPDWIKYGSVIDMYQDIRKL